MGKYKRETISDNLHVLLLSLSLSLLSFYMSFSLSICMNCIYLSTLTLPSFSSILTFFSLSHSF